MVLTDDKLDLFIAQWYNAMARLDYVRIKDEKSFLEYVDIYLSILDLRDIFSLSSEETNEKHTRWVRLRDLCNDKVIRMHGKINTLTMENSGKYRHLRGVIYNG